MKTNKQEQRRAEIESAAYTLLAEVGYKKTSMLAIAKKASASNETLYKWYGNKQNLFASLVKKNAETVERQLQKSIDNQSDTIETLTKIGPLILELISSEKAILLNRAAVFDVNETNTLGSTIAEQGRMKVTPLLLAVFQQAVDNKLFKNADAIEMTQVYLNILIGDIQIQRVIGVLEVLPTDIIELRSKLALKCIQQLYTS